VGGDKLKILLATFLYIFYHAMYCVFQDEANRCGGKWIVRLRKGLASRCWENLILAMLGEQFMVGEEICGAVVSIRFAVCIYLSVYLYYCQYFNF